MSAAAIDVSGNEGNHNFITANQGDLSDMRQKVGSLRSRIRSNILEM